jgi:hypothetical protein
MVRRPPTYGQDPLVIFFLAMKNPHRKARLTRLDHFREVLEARQVATASVAFIPGRVQKGVRKRQCGRAERNSVPADRDAIDPARPESYVVYPARSDDVDAITTGIDRSA